jgi:hypothetical protein
MDCGVDAVSTIATFAAGFWLAVAIDHPGELLGWVILGVAGLAMAVTAVQR